MKKENDKLYFATANSGLCEQRDILKSEPTTMKKENERSLNLTNDFANLKSQVPSYNRNMRAHVHIFTYFSR